MKIVQFYNNLKGTFLVPLKNIKLYGEHLIQLGILIPK